MREIRTSGSVGAPGRRRPGATRPPALGQTRWARLPTPTTTCARPSLVEEEGGSEPETSSATRGESPTDDDGDRHVGSESCVLVRSTRATVSTKRRQRACGARDRVPKS
jgi:hypothetical protein